MSAFIAREPPKRPLGPVRQRQILAATVELLREQGLWRMRVSDVAHRAHISPGSVVYYFGTKHQLFVEAIAGADADFYADLLPRLDEIESAVQRLAYLIRRSSETDWVLWIDLWVYARRHPDLRAAERKFHARWCQTFADVIRYGQGRGEFRAADADTVALRLGTLAEGLAVRMMLDESCLARDSYVAMSAEAAALELGCDLQALRDVLAEVPDDRSTDEAAAD